MPRITQLPDLLKLATSLQEGAPALEAVDRAKPMVERPLPSGGLRRKRVPNSGRYGKM